MSTYKQKQVSGKAGSVSAQQGKKPQKFYTQRVVPPGYFPEKPDGSLIRPEAGPNIARGTDAKFMSWEVLFKKTAEERKQLKKVKANWKMLMQIQYGEKWKSCGVYNPAAGIDKITKNFVLLK